MTDIKILALYKQHYRDYYKEALASAYSSWGYYDGISIHDFSSKSERKNESVFSDLWYSASDAFFDELKGIHGMQMIGLCRDRDENSDLFWLENNEIPFFAVAFLKIQKEKRHHIGDYMKQLEDEYNSHGFSVDWSRNSHTRAVCYYTLDAPDIVVLFHSNSLHSLHDSIIHLENSPGVAYSHTIQGVSELYLKACGKNKVVHHYFGNTNCNIDEPIALMNISFAAGQSRRMLNNIKNEMLKHRKRTDQTQTDQTQTDKYLPIKGLDKADYSFVSGHESILVSIPETDVRSAIVCMLPDGIITHQNTLYNEELYNISTTICVKKEILLSEELLKNEGMQENPSYDSDQSNHTPISWCSAIIRDYKEIAYLGKEEGDISFYSICLSIVKLLNNISQYENFSLAKDVFYLLQPALKMFHKQFCRCITIYRKTDIGKYTLLDQLKESSRRFLQSLDLIIYHTIHTDQTYLVYPGFSGNGYTIPIKLQLLYLWFMSTENIILNDSHNEYAFFISPVIEIPPVTEAMIFQGNENDRLVRVRLGHRILAFPVPLMLILGHEVAHYSGNMIRQRGERFLSICSTLGFYLSEMYLCPGSNAEKYKDMDDEVKKYFSEILKDRFAHEFFVYLNERILAEDGEKRFHSTPLKELLLKYSREIVLKIGTEKFCLSDKDYQKIDTLIKRSVDKETCRLYVDDMLLQMRINLRLMTLNNYMEPIVKNLIYMYKEIFSDSISQAILGFDYETYENAFLYSEGSAMPSGTEDQRIQSRKMIMKQIISGGIQKGHGGKQDTITLKSVDEIINKMFLYKQYKNDIIEYSLLCRQCLTDHLEANSEKKVMYNQLRRLFNIFTDSELHPMIKDLFQELNDHIELYERRVDSL